MRLGRKLYYSRIGRKVRSWKAHFRKVRYNRGQRKLRRKGLIY